MLFFIAVSADPNMPPNVVSTLTQDLIGNCMLQISWNTPDNAAMVDVPHFTITINGLNVVNKTYNGNGSLVQVAYALCSCGSQNISISAVNRCGRVGISSPIIILEDPEPFQQPQCDTEHNVTAIISMELSPTPSSGKITIVGSVIIMVHKFSYAACLLLSELKG